MSDDNNNLLDDREEASIGMEEADQFDFERAVQLMIVVEKCASVGVKATSIAGLAQAALNEMNEEAKDIAKRRAEAFAKAEAEAAAKRAREQQQAQAKAAAEAKAQQEAADAQARSASMHDEVDTPPRPSARPSSTPVDNRRL